MKDSVFTSDEYMRRRPSYDLFAESQTATDKAVEDLANELAGIPEPNYKLTRPTKPPGNVWGEALPAETYYYNVNTDKFGDPQIERQIFPVTKMKLPEDTSNTFTSPEMMCFWFDSFISVLPPEVSPRPLPAGTYCYRVQWSFMRDNMRNQGAVTLPDVTVNGTESVALLFVRDVDAFIADGIDEKEAIEITVYRRYVALADGIEIKPPETTRGYDRIYTGELVDEPLRVVDSMIVTAPNMSSSELVAQEWDNRPKLDWMPKPSQRFEVWRHGLAPVFGEANGEVVIAYFRLMQRVLMKGTDKWKNPVVSFDGASMNERVIMTAGVFWESLYEKICAQNSDGYGSLNEVFAVKNVADLKNLLDRSLAQPIPVYFQTPMGAQCLVGRVLTVGGKDQKRFYAVAVLDDPAGLDALADYSPGLRYLREYNAAVGRKVGIGNTQRNAYNSALETLRKQISAAGSTENFWRLLNKFGVPTVISGPVSTPADESQSDADGLLLREYEWDKNLPMDAVGVLPIKAKIGSPDQMKEIELRVSDEAAKLIAAGALQENRLGFSVRARGPKTKINAKKGVPVNSFTGTMQNNILPPVGPSRAARRAKYGVVEREDLPTRNAAQAGKQERKGKRK